MRSAALLLAAGRSSRMGEEKLFLPWGRATVLRATAEAILGAGFGRLIVVCGANEEKVGAALAGLRYELVRNAYAENGMHSSIRAGLTHAGELDAFAVCLGDQPTVPSELYARLLSSLGSAPLAAPLFGDRRGNPVVIAGRLIPEILDHADEDRGCAYLFKNHEAHLLEVEDPSVVQDLDTPQEYAALRAARFAE